MTKHFVRRIDVEATTSKTRATTTCAAACLLVLALRHNGMPMEVRGGRHREGLRHRGGGR